MDRLEEQARTLASEILPFHLRTPARVDAITAALRAAAKVGEGYVRDDKGVERKVLGTLPLTADGCVVGNHTRLWVNDVGCVTSLPVDNIGCSERDGADEAFWEAGECYSTPEAAQAAAERKNDEVDR